MRSGEGFGGEARHVPISLARQGAARHEAVVSAPELYLVTPAIDDAEAFAPRLEAALEGGVVAAVLLRLAGAEERTLVNRVKALGPLARHTGAAVVVFAEGAADLPALAIRGGADGVHVSGETADLGDLRGDLWEGLILGVGGLRSRDDAMTAAEAGADYLIFGEPDTDGTVMPLDAVAERAAWWAEIFETPCAVFAPTLDALPRLAATGAEFVAIGDAVWSHPDGPGGAVAKAVAAIERVR